MEQLFSNYPSTSIEENFKPVILDISNIQDLSEETNTQQVDISKAPVEELCSIVVTDLIKSVREDLANVKIAPKK